MSFAATAVLGAIAGLTIFFGLSVARLGRPGPRRMAFLVSASVGILVFLLYDVIRSASETVEDAMAASPGRGAGYGLVLAAGLGVGLLGLVVVERLLRRRRSLPVPEGPGAMAAGAVSTGGGIAALAAPQRTALFIAAGIGLHNLSEGLAIGQSAAGGALRLFYVLVIGFGLHNITEGFGVTGPLFAVRPSWRFLGLLGLIAGGPTFVGSVIGYWAVSPVLYILFLALAAGAILYVIGELQHAGRKIGNHDIGMVGLLCGFLAGYGTDLLLKSLGA